jgi:integrase
VLATGTADRRANGISGVLVVKTTRTGAVRWWGSWRDSGGRTVLRTLGAAHLTPWPYSENVFIRKEEERTRAAQHRESWRRSWRRAKGRPGDGMLDERAAAEALRVAILAREQEVDAEQEAQEVEAQGGPVLFGQVADEWITERADDDEDALKGSTVSDYTSMLRRPNDPVAPRGRRAEARIMREFDTVPVADVTTEQIEKWMRALRRAGLAVQTRNKYRVVLAMILDYAVAEKYIASSPMPVNRRRKRGQRRSRKKLVLYRMERVEEIARTAGGSFREIIRLAALTGLRQGELLALRWRDVDFEGRKIHVTATYYPGAGEDTPKSGDHREVPLSDQAAQVLARVGQRDDFTAPHDLVFANDVGDHIDASTVRRAYNTARDAVLAKADERKPDAEPLEPVLSFHKLRHTFGSTCASRGVPLATIMQWMGHADYSTTLIYVSEMPDQGDADRLSAAFASGAEEVQQAGPIPA